jgi:hypothetical protein
MMMNIGGYFWVILKFKWNGQKSYEMLEATPHELKNLLL